jgi:hypothetical protein
MIANVPQSGPAAEQGFNYDAFISYRWVDPDRSWVRNHYLCGAPHK